MSSGQYYDKVFVALISWENHDIDGLDEEMSVLEHVCSWNYGFDTTRIRIPNSTRTSPPGYMSYEDWLSAELESFYVRMEQEDEGLHLVIILYGGHGGETGPGGHALEWWSGYYESQMASRAIGSQIPWIGSPVDTELNWTDVWEDVRRGVHPSKDHLFILDCCYGESYCGRDIDRLLPLTITLQDAGQAQFLTSYHVMLAADSSNGNIAYSGYNSLTVVATSKLRDAIWEREGRLNPDGLSVEDLHHLIVSTGRCVNEPTLYKYGTHQDTDTIRWILVPSLSSSDDNASEVNSDTNCDEDSDGQKEAKSEIDSSEDENESDDSENRSEEGQSEQTNEIERSIDGIEEYDEDSDEEYEESEEDDESETDEDSGGETSQVGDYHDGEYYESSGDQNVEEFSRYKDWENFHENIEQSEEEMSGDDPGFYTQATETHFQDVDFEAEVGYWSY